MNSKEEQIAKYLSRVAERKDIKALLAPVQQAGHEAAELPGAAGQQEMAAAGIQRITRGEVPTSEQASSLEAIILPKIRPVLDVIGGDFHTDHPLWLKLNDDPNVREKLRTAIPSIGRIELPGHPSYPYGGTGFVVGKDRVMTNRHVAANFANGVGTRSLVFKPGYRAGIDFLRELDRPTGTTFRVKRVAMVHPYWDMALLVVEGLPVEMKPLRLSLRDIADGNEMVEVAAIGYPAFDTRNDSDVQNDLFRKVFGVKRLQPGTLGGREDTESFGKMVPALRHNCSTLGGNSGSAVVALDTGEVVALHFGGRYSKINYGVPSCELACDQRVVDAGVTFAGNPKGGSPTWAPWWSSADESAAGASAVTTDTQAVSNRNTTSTKISDDGSQSSSSALRVQPDGSIEIDIPLRITIRLGGKSAPAAITAQTFSAAKGESANLEKMVMPWHDDNYSTRNGYDPKFLEIAVPMPEPADPAVVAKTKENKSRLDYQNFSIVMHAKRRLALITASNVTAEAKLKEPEAGYTYSRKALSGLGKNDQERWFADPRLDDKYQLPDVFYTRDDGAFDKGHIVRREDVAWGITYNALRIANGDTYHVTNCSPQVTEFNQSKFAKDNWGSLENHVLKGAASERLCQFAGPILDPNDDTFVGTLGGVRVRVKTPSRFWKVIVARTNTGLAAYGFILTQDLSDVPLEFTAGEVFAPFLYPMADIAKEAGITFSKIILDADQYNTEEGSELAFHAGIKRRSLSEGVIEEAPIVRF